jgi:hypothetical protein
MGAGSTRAPEGESEADDSAVRDRCRRRARRQGQDGADRALRRLVWRSARAPGHRDAERARGAAVNRRSAQRPQGQGQYLRDRRRLERLRLGVGPDRRRCRRHERVGEIRGARGKSNKLGFVNKRAEWWWKFREALDPDSGDGVALPPDRELLADLTAPTWRLRMNGIQIESKDEIVARLQRSPDKGESLIYAASVPFIACAGLMNYMKRAATAGKEAQAAPETIRLRVPPGVGGFMIGGSLLQPDAEGVISVAPGDVNALLAAGYTRAAQA